MLKFNVIKEVNAVELWLSDSGNIFKSVKIYFILNWYRHIEYETQRFNDKEHIDIIQLHIKNTISFNIFETKVLHSYIEYSILL